MSVYKSIETLLLYAERYLCLSPRDEIYARNRLFDLLSLPGGSAEGAGELPELPDGIIEEIFSALEAEGRAFDRATLGEKLMDAVMLRPSEHEKIFFEKYSSSPREATDWAYDYAVRSNYVKKGAVEKNLKWRTEDGLGITINLSKPEKDNRDLARQLTEKSVSYPLCTICRENEGFERAGFSRRNMRTVSLKLQGEDWFWQYSPYAYFNEHGIAVSAEHAPMKLDEKTALRLFDFTDLFPHYFIGNNAPLPRVGGSILMHDHYQGGGEVLPMQRAGLRAELFSARYKGVRAGIVDWRNSVLRLEGEDRAALSALSYEIASAWREFSYPEGEILPYTCEPHNTASCIARKRGRGYVLDMILRNNRGNAEHPEGIFHAHREYHAIKSESIGLIEAMGLFILPARLKRQLGAAQRVLAGTGEAEADMALFLPMLERLKAEHGKVTEEEAALILKREVEDTCRAILCNTAVFKRDETGAEGWKRLLGEVGLKISRGEL